MKQTIDDLQQSVIDDCNRSVEDEAQRIWPDGLEELVSLAKEGSRLAGRVALVDLDKIRVLIREEVTAALVSLGAASRPASQASSGGATCVAC